MLYSGHDDTVSNAILYLKPKDFLLTEIPYASQVYFELHYDDECLKDDNDESCFTVEILHNGVSLTLDNC